MAQRFGCSLLHCHFYDYRLEQTQHIGAELATSVLFTKHTTIIPTRGYTGRKLAPNMPQRVMLLLCLFVYDLTGFSLTHRVYRRVEDAYIMLNGDNFFGCRRGIEVTVSALR